MFDLELCRYGNSALHYACEEERAEVAKLLIQAGANREVQVISHP